MTAWRRSLLFVAEPCLAQARVSDIVLSVSYVDIYMSYCSLATIVQMICDIGVLWR